MSRLEMISDHSKEKLTKLPEEILSMSGLKMLFLEGNFLTNLSEDLFWKLPNLIWLDLRNNLLENLPKSIGHHKNLENLLLTNNNLKELPNELGLLPKLKALQVADNPLVYPIRRIVVEGTKAIKNFLRDQYERSIRPQKIPETDFRESEEDEERVLTILEENTSEEDRPGRRPGSVEHKNRNVSAPTNSKVSLAEAVKIKLSDPKLLKPTLSVKRMGSSGTATKRRKREEPIKIIHKIDRTGSKISLRSTFNKIGMRADMSKKNDKSLREGWLNQLRILLNDQERILQQERNLRALSTWRMKKKPSTPKVFYDESKYQRRDAPYATDPKYSKIPTRDELAAQLTNFFKEKGVVVSQENRDRGVDISKLINDLTHQLKEMEVTYNETRSPRTEIDQAGRQIKMIMEIQKKLLRLKASNESSLY